MSDDRIGIAVVVSKLMMDDVCVLCGDDGDGGAYAHGGGGGNGQVRYVIDFYTGVPQKEKPVSMYLDVRPALDSVGALTSRVGWQIEKLVEEMGVGSVLEYVRGSTTTTGQEPAAATGKQQDSSSGVVSSR